MKGLPEGWVPAMLGQIAGGGQYGWTTKATDNGTTKFLRTTDITRGPINWGSVPYCDDAPANQDKYALRSGDILISRAGSVGFSALLGTIPYPSVFASYLIRFLPKRTAVVPRYLAHFLRSPQYWQQIAGAASGIALANVNASKLAEVEVPLGPLPEQERIADKLDAVVARVDACRDHLDRVPVILKRFRQSVLSAACSGRLTEEWRAANGRASDVRSLVFQEDSVAIPEHWHDCPLAGLIDSRRPLCYGVVQPGEAATGGVPLVRVQDMESGTVNVHGLRTVSADVDAQYRRSRVKSGDLLVSVVGTIGRTAIVPSGIEANIARAIARIACRGGVDSRWVNIWLTSDALQWWMARSAREVARKTLNLSELGATRVAVPPADEQIEIVRRVESLFAWADRLEARHAAARAHVERLTPALLAKAFRGELVPQDPADEPASELLERLGQRSADNPTSLPKRQGAKRSRANAAQAASSA